MLSCLYLSERGGDMQPVWYDQELVDQMERQDPRPPHCVPEQPAAFREANDFLDAVPLEEPLPSNIERSPW